MNEVLTVAESEARYDSEWVLLGDPVTDKANNVLSGTVIAHSRDQDAVYRQAIKLKPRRCATLFTGDPLPEGTAIVL